MVEANLQICDVMIKEDKHRWYVNHGSIPLSSTLVDAVILLVRFAKQEDLMVGDSRDFSRKGEYTCNLFRSKRNEYKFCFHTGVKN